MANWNELVLSRLAAVETATAALAAIVAGGKIPVDIGSSLVNVDMATVDVNALIAGIANGKTLSDLDSTTGAVAAAVIAGIADGKTLDDVVDANGNILSAICPSHPVPRAAATLENDNWNEAFVIPEHCVACRIVFDKKAYCVAGITGNDPAENGAPFYANLRYPLIIGADGTNNRVFVKNGDAGQNVTAEPTFFCTQ